MASALSETYDNLTMDSKQEYFFTNLYVPRDLPEISQLLFQLESKIKEHTRILFTGHRGSGKTSELRRLKYELEKKDFFVVYVSTIDDLRLSDINYIDIFLMVIKKTIEQIDNDGSLKIDGDDLSEVEKLIEILSGNLTIEDIKTKKVGFGLTGILSMITAHLSSGFETREKYRKGFEEVIDEIINLYNYIISVIEKQTSRKVVIVVDDLEKTPDRKQILEVLDGQSKVISKLCCHFILTLPTYIVYSTDARQVNLDFCSTYFLPIYEVKTKSGTLNSPEILKMIEIAKKRIINNCVNVATLEDCAIMSGGLMHDFLRLLANSCSIANSKKENKVSHAHLLTSFKSLSQDAKIGLDAKYVEILKDIHKTKEIKITSDIKDLIYNLAILHYKSVDGDYWYDVHPAVVAALDLDK